MALNWSSFITDEGLGLSQSFSSPQRKHQSSHPPPSRHQSLGSYPITDLIDDSYFSEVNSCAGAPQDAMPADGNTVGDLESFVIPDPYFQDELDPLNSFEGAMTGPSTSTVSPSESALCFTPESTYAYRLQKGPMDDVTWDQKPDLAISPSVTSGQTRSSRSPDVDFLPDSTDFSMMAVEDPSFEIEDASKRSRSKADHISACWESPLCPNKPKPGERHPSPSSCGGACAPFLFDSNAPTTFVTGLDAGIDIPPSAAPIDQGLVQIQKPRNKRLESNGHQPSGRTVKQSPITHPSPPIKYDSSHESSPDALPTVEEEEHSTSNGAPTSKAKPSAGNSQRRRLPHNQVERKYRESLNSQLESLRRVIPALQQPTAPSTASQDDPNGCPGDNADIEDLPAIAPSKPSKAVVLASATAYIKQLEREKKLLAEENAAMNARMKAFGVSARARCDDCSLMHYVKGLKIHGPA